MIEISIIIPVFNLEKYLHRCIESIINQSFTSFEVIVIDDGSQDNSQEICKVYLNQDSRIRLITQENRGVSSARNEGLKNARGRYVVFIDGDDYIEKDFLLDLYDIMHNKLVEVGICGYTMIYDSINHQEMLMGQDFYLNQEKLLLNLFKPNGFKGYCCNKIFDLNIIVQNALNFRTDIKIKEDLLFVYQYFLCINTGYYINKPLYNYTQHQNSAMHLIRRETCFSIRRNNFDTMTTVLKSILDLLPQNYKHVLEYIQIEIITQDIDFCMGCIALKQSPHFFKTVINEIKSCIMLYIKNKDVPIKSKIYAGFLCIHWKLAYIIQKLNRKILKYKNLLKFSANKGENHIV